MSLNQFSALESRHGRKGETERMLKINNFKGFVTTCTYYTFRINIHYITNSDGHK